MTGTANVHPEAQLRPTKMELLSTWLPTQPWFDGNPGLLERIAFYRFADPDGEVGLDGMLIASAGSVFHVPVTWRAAPLPEGDLIGTLEHSVLGTRYCYDAPSDPVFVAELARVIRESDTDADIVAEGQSDPRPRTIAVKGTGSVTGKKLGEEPVVVRKLDGIWPEAAAHLVGTWKPGGEGRSDVLATLE
ncbi:maltokinase N-terminal cap-like domain-containing protein [Tessaracoccus antarcticus]|uniref:Maltokinase N-terminal cap domain-containing protein n=1 Tax=Tessaracoccus antarcticus TaxID=2479848 RepID=A0A3M0FZX1_9ACTN|nr:hypothetical protein [Tessaracoccus antarcticus]RMB58224.1 hypothetical protein EAX62_13535 [Tessaracoccus antarcticus]